MQSFSIIVIDLMIGNCSEGPSIVRTVNVSIVCTRAPHSPRIHPTFRKNENKRQLLKHTCKHTTKTRCHATLSSYKHLKSDLRIFLFEIRVL